MPALGLKLRINRITAKILSVYTTGLVMWHKFLALPWDGSTDRLPDSSGSGNNAKLFTGTGLSFDGTNDVVTIGSTGQTVRSVVFYAYPDTTTQSFMQLTASGGVDVKITSGTLSGTGWTSPVYYVNGAAGTTVAEDVWQQIVVTSATGITASDVRLGLDNTTYYSGDLCNVKFFSAQLTAAQIAELYANPEEVVPTGLTTADLVGWWYLSEGVGELTLDASGNNNGGAIAGASWVNALPSPVTQLGLLGGSAPMYWGDTNDYVSCGTTTGALNITGSKLTIYLKCATTAPQNNSFDIHLFRGSSGLNQGYAIGRLASNRLYFGTYGLTTGSGDLNADIGDAPENDTLNIICIYDGTNKYIYVNGVLEKSLAATGNIGSFTSQALRIGNSSSANVKGVIFEAGVWNEALTTTQIAAIQSGTKFETIQTANLQGAWRNTGNTNADWLDLSGNNQNGTVNGSPVTAWLPAGETAGRDVVDMTQKFNNTGQLILNGTNYGQVADAASLDITTNITVSAWVKPLRVGVAQTIVAKNAAYQLEITSGNKLSFSFWSSSTEKASPTTTTTLAVNVWKYVTAVYNGSNVKIYIDGALDTTVNQTGSIDTNSNAVILGGLTSSSELLGATIDSVKVYNDDLTADQVLQNYKAEKYKYQ